MTQPISRQDKRAAGARSRRRRWTAVVMAIILAAVLATPAAQAQAESRAGFALAFCERLERLAGDLFAHISAALRPERLGAESTDQPIAASTSDGDTLDHTPGLRPERLGGPRR